jgi:hypothetical protein
MEVESGRGGGGRERRAESGRGRKGEAERAEREGHQYGGCGELVSGLLRCKKERKRCRRKATVSLPSTELSSKTHNSVLSTEVLGCKICADAGNKSCTRCNYERLTWSAG